MSSTATAFWKQDGGGFAPDTAYTILTAPNLSSFRPEQFTGNSIDGAKPRFKIVGNDLQVSFEKD